FGAMLRDRTPVGKAGMFQGLRIVAQVLIPGIVGPAIGAAVLKNAETVVNNDGTTSFIPNQNISLAALIVAAALVLMLAVQFAAAKKKEAARD
ncbi:MAG: MFS transporter, partial [Clostridia bacterium]|nr:MFS transporter [Clostridia bacterium]